MITNTVQIEVPASVEKAFDFFTQVSYWPQWMSSVKSAELIGKFNSEGVISLDYGEGMGTRMQLTSLVPNSFYEYASEMKDMRISGRTEFSPIEGGCLVRYEEKVEPRSIMLKLMSPFLGRSIKSALEKDFAKAKGILLEQLGTAGSKT